MWCFYQVNPVSPLQSLFLRMSPIVVKAASLPSAPAVQATVDPEDLFIVPQTLSPSFAKRTLSLLHALLYKPGSACSTRPCWCASPSLALPKSRWVLPLAGAHYRQNLKHNFAGNVQQRLSEMNWLRVTASSGDTFCSATGSRRCLDKFPGDPRSRTQRLLHKELLTWFHVPAAQQELPGGQTAPCRCWKQNHDLHSRWVTAFYLKYLHYEI